MIEFIAVYLERESSLPVLSLSQTDDFYVWARKPINDFHGQRAEQDKLFFLRTPGCFDHHLDCNLTVYCIHIYIELIECAERRFHGGPQRQYETCC